MNTLQSQIWPLSCSSTLLIGASYSGAKNATSNDYPTHCSICGTFLVLTISTNTVTVSCGDFGNISEVVGWIIEGGAEKKKGIF